MLKFLIVISLRERGWQRQVDNVVVVTEKKYCQVHVGVCMCACTLRAWSLSESGK